MTLIGNEAFPERSPGDMPKRRLILRLIAVSLMVGIITPVAQSAPANPASKIAPSLARKLVNKSRVLPVIVRFISRPGKSDVQGMIAAGFHKGMIRYEVVPALYAEGPASAIRSAANNPRVAFIEYDEVIPYALDRATKATRARPVWDATYRLLDQVHSGGFTGRGVGVAIVDGGIDATHPDLLWKPLAAASGQPPKTAGNFKIEGRDSVGLTEFLRAGGVAEANMLAVDMADTDTTGGHGTHVAGIAAGNGRASRGKYQGAAPGANLIGLGAGETLVVHMGLAAFDWIHRNHKTYNIRVVNNSWGGAGDWDPDVAVTKAVRRLVNDDGIVVVFAAGNSGGNGTNIETSVWGNIPEVIQVANYYDGSGWLHSSSSRGMRSREDTWPDFAAPGTEIISTAANAKPITLFGTGQDAVINHLFGYGEPDVVPLPIPAPVEVQAGTTTVMAGNYASVTGTSMASPFVAGVVALMLEANASLVPLNVKEILRETANMPSGRSYEGDGYAVGKGVVDAGEAVAVALRMKEGSSLTEALRTAYVDYASSPSKINLRKPRMLNIVSPNDGAAVGRIVEVTGNFTDGPVTDDSIPLAPAGKSIFSGQGRIYQAGVVDPFVFGGGVIVPGEPVELSVRGITGSRKSRKLAEGKFEGSHRILRAGQVAYGPFDTSESKDGDEGEFQTNSEWNVPSSAPIGNYVFEGSIVLPSGERYVTARVSFSIGLPASAQLSSSVHRGRVRTPSLPISSAASHTFFSDDFEDEGDGWTTEQDGEGPGLLTEWTPITDSSLSWAGVHSGQTAFYAGHWPGAEWVNGIYYEDFADTSLVSPVIDLTNAETADLSFWLVGASEPEADFLTVEGSVDGTGVWQELDKTSGDFIFGGDVSGWEERHLSLTSFVGSKMRLRFRFTTDGGTVSAFQVGWYVDDVRIVGNPGIPGVVIRPSLVALPSSGVGSLDTVFEISARANVKLDRLELDFGDGSPIFSTTNKKDDIDHTFPVGQWHAKLTAISGATSRSTGILIDVAPFNRLEIRLAGGGWRDLGAADSDRTFTTSLRLPGAEHTIEVRSCATSGRCLWDRAKVSPASVSGSPRRTADKKNAPITALDEPEATPFSPSEAGSQVVNAPPPLQTEVKGASSSVAGTAALLMLIVSVALGLRLFRARLFAKG